MFFIKNFQGKHVFFGFECSRKGTCLDFLRNQQSYQGTKLTFFSRSHLAPKFSKVVAKSKKLGAMKKKKG